MRKYSHIALAICALGTVSRADIYTLPPADVDLVGVLTTTQVQQDETLLDIARHFDIGQNEIKLANPDLNRWIPPEGAKVLLPKRFILPAAPHQGIVQYS